MRLRVRAAGGVVYPVNLIQYEGMLFDANPTSR